MENSQRLILSEIKEMISSMYRQVHELENKLGEIEIQVDKALGSEPETVKLDFVPAVETEEDRYVGPDSESAEKMESVEESESGKDSESTEVVEPVEGVNVRLPESSPAEKTSVAEELEKGSRLAVMDVMTAKEPWRTDRPGSELKDIRSAISLNDRVLFINYLFREDPSLFLDTVSVFNSMEKLDEAVDYLKLHFPEWDMQSEVVYRFMMAVRRKLR